MKKALLLFSILAFSTVAIAKDNAPDPLYLATPPLNPDDFKKEEKVKDPRTFSERFRAKFNLPPTKKIYLHNIDKSGQPITMDDYYKLAIDKKRKDFIVPTPVFNQEEDIILPNPQFRVIRYNTPPGQRNIDLRKIVANNKANSPGILSPDKTKMVYTQSVFLRMFSQTASHAYYIPVANPNDAYDVLFNTNVVQQQMDPILSVGFEEIQQNQFKTLFPIDWSKDSRKIAFKEKVGSNIEQTWQTNVVVYDFETKRVKRLTAVREAIVYHWRSKDIDLKNYMWDIFPVGWDKNNPDRMIVYAYAFTTGQPMFLGTWSIDSNENKSELISIDSTQVEIDLNGYGLKEIKLEH